MVILRLVVDNDVLVMLTLFFSQVVLCVIHDTVHVGEGDEFHVLTLEVLRQYRGEIRTV